MLNCRGHVLSCAWLALDSPIRTPNTGHTNEHVFSQNIPSVLLLELAIIALGRSSTLKKRLDRWSLPPSAVDTEVRVRIKLTGYVPSCLAYAHNGQAESPLSPFGRL